MKEKNPKVYYPVFLDLSGRRCVVVGGGQVALRKVEALLGHGARVEVVSPALASELDDLAQSGQIRVLRRRYQAGDLKGAFLAIAATDDRETNLQVVKEARDSAVLVNVADDPERSDFIVPSYMRRGDVTVAVSTGGKSPALARKMRTRLERELGDEYASLALLVNRIRAEAKRQGIQVSGEGWQEALDLDLMLDLLRKGDEGKARAILLANLKAQAK